MIGALHMYSEGLQARGREAQRVLLSDGTTLPVEFGRYLGPAGRVDQQLLGGLRGPVLDVGCGPGRHLHALGRRGVFALGVDLSPVAVELAVRGGARAVVGNIFDELPAAGWQSALLLDGNIGIGGSPGRLLARIAQLLGPGGVVLVEVGPPHSATGPTRARLVAPSGSSDWFPWARVAASAIGHVGRAAGFQAARVWSLEGRWFARLVLRRAARLR